MGTPPKSSEPASYNMKSPLLLVPPSAPPHDHDHEQLPYHPPPALPEAHPLARVTMVPPSASAEEEGEEGAQPVHVDAAARQRAERLAAERLKEEATKAEMAEREAIYQSAREQATLLQAEYRGRVQDRSGMQALAVDPNEHARGTPPLDEVLPPKGRGNGNGGGGGGGKGYEIGAYKVEAETQGYKVAEYRSIYDKR